MSELQITNLSPGLWALWDDGINLYLIAGQDRAVLLDSGFGFFAHLRRQCEDLCGVPVDLVHTHAHGDHTGGDGEWSQSWLHPADWPDYRRDRGQSMVLHPLEDGMRLDLGERMLEVLHVPGHTRGSVALLDRENRLLFSGDTVMAQPVFLFVPNASLPDYQDSLERLKGLLSAYDTVYPFHQRFPLQPAPALVALLDCVRQALENNAEGMVTFDLDMKVVIARFSGYQSDGFAVAIRDLGPVVDPG